MSRCDRCNVEILDDTMICPLCKSVVEREGDDDNAPSHSLMYPDVMPAMKRLRFVMKLLIFISIILETMLIVINYLTYNGVSWSAICGVGFFYLCFTVYYSCQRHTEHRTKLAVFFLTAMLLMIIIDNIAGYSGWAINYVTPVMIMVMDVVVVILMLANSRSWQSYIMMQLLIFIVCIIGMLLVLLNIINRPLLMIIATGVTGIIIVGTMIFGDKKASGELFRKFKM